MKKFHEIDLAKRVALLLYLCQNKLDTETPAWIQILHKKPRHLLCKLKAQGQVKAITAVIPSGELF